jgi:hypothetical protein
VCPVLLAGLPFWALERLFKSRVLSVIPKEKVPVFRRDRAPPLA